MVEVTETQSKELVSNIQKLSDMEERKVPAAFEIVEKQLQYFKIQDSEIAITQRGLVQAVNGLSEAIVQVYAKRTGGGLREQTPPTVAPNSEVPAGGGRRVPYTVPHPPHFRDASVPAHPPRQCTDGGARETYSVEDIDMAYSTTEDDPKEDCNVTSEAKTWRNLQRRRHGLPESSIPIDIPAFTADYGCCNPNPAS
jgi:hypothetical protein